MRFAAGALPRSRCPRCGSLQRHRLLWLFLDRHLHVLEHVGDDRGAMAEMWRVLRPGGTAIVQVPTYGPITDEDPAVVDPAERRARFGQEDHVRLYGHDVYDRLAEAGFAVERRVFRDQISARDRARYGLDYRGTVVDYGPIDDVWTIPLCRKPVPS